MATETASANTTTNASRPMGGRGGRGGSRASQQRYVEIPHTTPNPDVLTCLLESMTRGNDAKLELLKQAFEKEFEALQNKIIVLESKDSSDNKNEIEALKEQFRAKHELFYQRMGYMDEQFSTHLEKFDSRIKSLESTPSDANRRIRDLETNLGELGAKHADLQAKFDNLEDAFKALVKIVSNKH
jgi:chromosome segregation ATPase